MMHCEAICSTVALQQQLPGFDSLPWIVQHGVFMFSLQRECKSTEYWLIIYKDCSDRSRNGSLPHWSAVK